MHEGPEKSSLRRFRRALLAVAVVALLVCLATSALWLWYPFGDTWSAPSLPMLGYMRAYDQGVAEARRDLAADRAVNLHYGLPEWDERLDRATGLPNRTTGCLVDDRIKGYVRGYRATVSAHIAKHGLPANSRKPWEPILFDLLGYFSRRKAAGPPLTLVVDGDEAASPDGNCVVRAWIRKPTDDIPDAYLCGTIRSASGKETEWSGYPLSPENKSLEYFWGPSGSDVLVVRGYCSYGKEPGLLTGALDLRSGCWLRYEFVVATHDHRTRR